MSFSSCARAAAAPRSAPRRCSAAASPSARSAGTPSRPIGSSARVASLSRVAAASRSPSAGPASPASASSVAQRRAQLAQERRAGGGTSRAAPRGGGRRRGTAASPWTVKPARCSRSRASGASTRSDDVGEPARARGAASRGRRACARAAGTPGRRGGSPRAARWPLPASPVPSSLSTIDSRWRTGQAEDVEHEVGVDRRRRLRDRQHERAAGRRRSGGGAGPGRRGAWRLQWMTRSPSSDAERMSQRASRRKSATPGSVISSTATARGVAGVALVEVDRPHRPDAQPGDAHLHPGPQPRPAVERRPHERPGRRRTRRRRRRRPRRAAHERTTRRMRATAPHGQGTSPPAAEPGQRTATFSGRERPAGGLDRLHAHGAVARRPPRTRRTAGGRGRSGRWRRSWPARGRCCPSRRRGPACTGAAGRSSGSPSRSAGAPLRNAGSARERSRGSAPSSSTRSFAAPGPREQRRRGRTASARRAASASARARTPAGRAASDRARPSSASNAGSDDAHRREPAAARPPASPGSSRSDVLQRRRRRGRTPSTAPADSTTAPSRSSRAARSVVASRPLDRTKRRSDRAVAGQLAEQPVARLERRVERLEHPLDVRAAPVGDRRVAADDVAQPVAGRRVEQVVELVELDDRRRRAPSGSPRRRAARARCPAPGAARRSGWPGPLSDGSSSDAVVPARSRVPFDS